MAPPLVPSVATDGVVTENNTGGETMWAGTGTEEVTRGSVGGEELGTAVVRGGAVITPTSQQQRPALMEMLPGKPTGLSLNCWRR